MAFQPIPNTAKLLLQFVVDGQKVENVFYAQDEGGWTPSKLMVLAQAAFDEIETNWMSSFNSDCSLVSVVARDMSTEGGSLVTFGGSGPVGGTQTGTPAPNNVTLAIHKVLGISGRHSKARAYWPQIRVNDLVSPNTIAASAAATICQHYRDLKVAIETVDGITALLGSAELVDGGVALAVGIFHTILDFVCLDLVVDSQRRRLPGRGR